MPMVRAMRMLNAVEAGTLSGAQFEALLADAGRLGEWQQLLVMRGQTRRMAASIAASAAASRAAARSRAPAGDCASSRFCAAARRRPFCAS